MTTAFSSSASSSTVAASIPLSIASTTTSCNDTATTPQLPTKPSAAIIAPPRLKSVQSQPGLEISQQPFRQPLRRAPTPPHHELARIGGYWLDYQARPSGERWSMGQGNLSEALQRLSSTESGDERTFRALFYALFLLRFFPKVYQAKLQPALSWYHQVTRLMAQFLYRHHPQRMHEHAIGSMEYAVGITFQGRWEPCSWWWEEVPAAVAKEEEREEILSSQEKYNRWRVGVWKVGWVWADSADDWITQME